ncbi:cyclopropane-fatty-acyl-phospholipid synthase family protein [Kitasatospora sp. NBC_01250]|uniref:cyclopropane-fatty-acyl-phospholipid synthase family protein n=1 Tax=unclassified Kitasatospora TaxID=2633591 RepID=UPI002E0D8A94|nr:MULTISPECIES: cyclopropane-fatty-acyl-phospholipid synthase family protein [unclassified Kitasatospora]WSJ72157.1 cyclopropane-fatty-acyl-phospholipid synthase family protein [Kitasatospora sp. NBC_01302]
MSVEPPAGPPAPPVDPPVDPLRWPDVARQPNAPARAAVARRLLGRIAGQRGLRVELPDGRALVPAPAGAPVLRLRRPQAFFHRIGAGGLIGFGESYQAGDWDSPDLVALLATLAADPEALVPTGTHWLRRLCLRRTPAAELSTAENARGNIRRHYDLSNELFALFLDPTMTYSAAVFPTDRAHAPLAGPANLAEAQRRKIDRLLDLAHVGPGSRVLEIGTGWGELALRAAARGARVVSLTLSEEQLLLARHRIRAAGQADRAEVRLCDYRAAEGEFDAVVSVEMIEAVGRPFWPAYLRTIDRVLGPGGRVALQAITMPHQRMLASSGTYTWILKYVFPGGQIPSVQAIEETAARATRLRVTARCGYGAHYAETLRLWRERFTERAAEVAELGFDQAFRRMWEFYLAYSEAGFRTGYLDVQQFLLTREGLAR